VAGTVGPVSGSSVEVDATVGGWSGVVEASVGECVGVMRAGSGADWSSTAGRLDWDCRETALHLASDFTAYAGQLMAPRQRGYVPFDIIFAGEPGADGMAEVVRATGGLLSAAARATGKGVQSWHPYGMAGPADFCAMGAVEAIVHTHDLARGLNIEWDAPDWIAARVLQHLFRQEAGPGDSWHSLLVATGRVPADDGIYATTWRWYNTGT
jgi:hypothetical protein